MPIKCRVCHSSFQKLVPAHIKSHGISVDTYRRRFPDAAFTEVNRDLYIKKANSVHNNRYDYSLSNFDRTTDKIQIICPEHGIFLQKLNDHISSKHGCPRCVHNYPYTISDIRQKSKLRYGDKYTILDPFLGMKHPLTLVCTFENHGQFTLKQAEGHFVSAGGCPKCALAIRLDNLKPGNISKVEKLWLDSLGVPLRQHKVIIGPHTFIVDGFDPSTNTVYECYGSFWHGNPEQYNSTDMNTVLNKTYGELYQKTMIKESLLKTQFTVVSKWV